MTEKDENGIVESGTSLEMITCDSKELDLHGYKKLPPIVFERMSMLLQNAPGLVAQKMTETAANKALEGIAKDAYRVVLKDGMHLAKSKSMPGAFKGLLFSNDTNKLVTHADLIPVSINGKLVSAAPQVALGVFNVMSVATGQFFLSQINGKLGSLENGVADVLGYLAIKTRSEVAATDYTLMDIFKNLGFIMDNDLERQSTIVELKRLKSQSLGNVMLFDAKIKQKCKDLKLTSKSDADDLDRVFKELHQDIPQYWCSLRSYMSATVLEVVLAEMDDPEYLQSTKEDLLELVNQYNDTCNNVNKRIDVFIEKAKDLNKDKKLPKGIVKLVDYVPVYNVPGIGVKVLVHGVDEIDNHIAKSSRKKKEKALSDRDSFWDACHNLDPLEESIELIDIYSNNRNESVEIVITDDAAYIKCEDDNA